MPKSRHRPTIGITGNIATGKSLVLGLLEEHGACGIDADAVYHRLISPGAPLLAAITKEFGSGVLAHDGSLDRRALGQIVFADPNALSRLDEITHPVVVSAIRADAANAHCPVVVIDAVKLVESGLNNDCDQVWLVTADRATQITRLMARNKISRGEAARRIDAQASDAERRRSADIVIDNSGTIMDTTAQVDAAWTAFQERFGPQSV